MDIFFTIIPSVSTVVRMRNLNLLGPGLAGLCTAAAYSWKFETEMP
jgi:hypothetical protein